MCRGGAGRHAHVDADADHRGDRAGQLAVDLDQDAAQLRRARDQVVRPLEHHAARAHARERAHRAHADHQAQALQRRHASHRSARRKSSRCCARRDSPSCVRGGRGRWSAARRIPRPRGRACRPASLPAPAHWWNPPPGATRAATAVVALRAGRRRRRCGGRAGRARCGARASLRARSISTTSRCRDVRRRPRRGIRPAVRHEAAAPELGCRQTAPDGRGLVADAVAGSATGRPLATACRAVQ
jgi:hypothetical protein